MTRAICCEDDLTSHGGKVMKVSGSFSIDGRHNARLFDLVSCPMHGDNPIVEASHMIDNGVAVALHGCKTACGSVVIAGSRAKVAV